MKYLERLIILVLLLSFVRSVWAEDDTDVEELNIIELEIEKNVVRKKADPVQEKKVEEQKSSDYSSLGKLAPFSEVSVLQKRYMPKTSRVQLFGGYSLITNDPFFSTTGLTAKISYFFTEAWGIEGNYFNLSTAQRDSTKELVDIQGVNADGLVYTKNFTGIDVVWVPIYGKMSYFNQKIIPFDLYFSLGYGTTSTHSDEKPGTWHLASGQIFAITKSFALRWDFSWNFFNAKGIEQTTASYNNLFLTVGASFFIPEAKYR